MLQNLQLLSLGFTTFLLFLSAFCEGRLIPQKDDLLKCLIGLFFLLTICLFFLHQE